MRIFIHILVSLCLVSSSSFAQVSSPGENFMTGTGEYYVGREQGKPLITVSLLNGVQRPGVYHVPMQTTLPQLVAYAGGTMVTTDADNIHLRRVDRDKNVFIRHDLTEIMKHNDAFPVMQDKDVVQFREHPNLDTTLRWVTIFSGIATIALSAVTIHSLTKN